MRATFRFHGPLNDFLPARLRLRDVPFEAPVAPSVKDAIESLGPPHVEVAHVVVDGEPVGFERLLADGQRVAVHPDDAALAGLRRTAPSPPRPVRFVLDAHLRRLAVHLRLLGFDTRWWRDADDADLARVSAKERRVLLTRDLGLLKRAIVVHGGFVRATDPGLQLREIVDRYTLAPDALPFSRCLRCNGDIVPVPKQDVLDRLRPGTRRSYHRFRMCAACDRVFWRGAHYGRLLRIVREVMPEWQDPRDADDEEERAMTDDGHWWETFFSGLWLDVQRTLHGAAGSLASARAAAGLLALKPGARVLDAPCGHGRLSLPLAEMGHTVVGVDRCEELLVEARAAAAERSLPATFENRDLRELEYDGEFDAALCWWGSFGYFDDVGNMEQARVVCRALRPGGRYVIDTPVVESLMTRWEDRGWHAFDDLLLLEDRRWSHATGRLDCEWTIIRGRERAVRRSSIRLYTYREIICLLEAAGFSRFDAFGRGEGEPFDRGSSRLRLVATKL